MLLPARVVKTAKAVEPGGCDALKYQISSRHNKPDTARPRFPAPKITAGCRGRCAAARIGSGGRQTSWRRADGRRQRMRIGILAAEPGGGQALGKLADQLRRAADDGLA